MSNERERWADFAKGIGIIFVIIGHIKYVDNSIKEWIYTFHMPLFFFISGYFINKHYGLLKDIGHKAYILLIPYFILSVIEFILEDILLILFGMTPEHMTIKHLVGSIIQFPYPNEYESTFWFFGCLFITSVILLALVYIFKENKYKILATSTILMVIGTILINVLKIRLIWNIDIALIMTFYASFGYFVKQSHILDKYNSIDKKYKILIIMVCGILGILFMKLTNIDGHIDYYTRNIKSPVYCLLAGISNIILIVALSNMIETYFKNRKKANNLKSKLEIFRSEDIEYIGRNSGAFYVLSAWGIHVGYLAVILLKQVVEIRYRCTATIISLITAIMLPIPIILILNKTLPHIFRNGNTKKKTIPKDNIEVREEKRAYSTIHENNA